MLKQGHTLIEMILYTTFTVVGLLIAGMFILSVLHTDAHLRQVTSIANNGSFTLEHIAHKVRSSRAMTEPNASSSAQVLSFRDDVTNQIVTFEVVGGALVEHDASSSFALTTSDVTVRDLQFTRIVRVKGNSAVQISLTLVPSVSEGFMGEISEQFITSAVSRLPL